MSEHIATLGQLLDGAGTQWRAFDIGRHITKLDKQQFLAVEQALNIKVVKTTKNMFFKFLLNIMFSPGFIC